jgi:hypothetical protein
MLNTIALAHSLAIISAVVFLLFHLIRSITPIGFRFLFNSHFLGADVASLLSPDIPLGGFIISFIVLVASSWIFGYVLAWLYNRLAK